MSKGRKQTEKVTKYRKPININLGLVIFSVLFIYIVVIIVSYFRSEHITPYEVSVGSLAVNNTYEGIVLREERVVESPYSGYVNYYARESEKVNNGAMIFTVDSTGKLSDLIKDSEGSGTLSDEDMATLEKAVRLFKKQLTIPCTACRYCVDHCPMKINIPEYLKVLNDVKANGDMNLWKAKNVDSEGTPADCIGCGSCTVQCPQSLEIPKYMAELAEKLEKHGH